jgi:anti-sigma-K factor RskA
MIDETHVLELLPAYALECLDEAETRLVAEHLPGCHLCRTELRAFQDVTGQLAYLAPEASPSPDLRSRLQERIQALKSSRAQASRAQPIHAPTGQAQMRRSPVVRRPLFGRLVPVGGILGLVLIALLLASNILLWQRMNNLEVLAGPLGMRAVALQNTDVAPQASAFVIISSDGQNGVLVVDELPQLDSGLEYQLWLVRGEQTTSAAVFSVDETGYRGMRIEAPDSLLKYSAVRVTIEPQGGSAQPGGEEVLKGSLFNP